MITEHEKADTIRDAIRKTVKAFNDEGKPELGAQTFKAMESAWDDNATMARLWDIFERGLSKSDAIAAIKEGAA